MPSGSRSLGTSGGRPLAVGVVAVLAAGCTFPEIGFEPLGGTAGTGGTTVAPIGGGGTGGAPSSAGGTGGSGGTGGLGGLGGLPPTGGSTGSIPTGGTGGACDGDGDGHEAMGACGGDDCDDTNKLIYPGQPIFYTTPNDKGFDWDCDGLITRDPKSDKTVTCALGGCDTSTQGYYGSVPGCGEAANWGTCKSAFPLCLQDVLEKDKPMGCK